MARTIACPKCSEKFQVQDEQLGTQVACPSCGANLKLPKPPEAAASSPRPENRVAPAPLPPSIPPLSDPIAAGRPSRRDDPDPEPRGRRGYDEDDDYDRPRRRQRRDWDDGPPPERWGTTIVGLKMIFWAVLIMLIFVVLLQTFAVIGPNRDLAAVMGATAIVGGCSVFIAAIVAFVGMCMCAAAPYKPASRLALSSVLCVGAAILGALILGFIVAATVANAARPNNQGFGNPADVNVLLRAGAVGIVGVVILSLLMLAAVICWMLFHAAIGTRFQNSGLRTQSIVYLVVYILYSAASIAAQFLLVGGGNFGNPQQPRLFLLIQMLASAALWSWFLVICVLTYRSIERGQRVAADDYDRRDDRY
ncbi:MAG: hypothetical protein U0744_13920 [Gemmataceae bacterium]